MSKYERELCMCEENYKLSLHNSITIHYAFEGDQGGTGKYLIHQIQITKDKQLEEGSKVLRVTCLKIIVNIVKEIRNYIIYS